MDKEHALLAGLNEAQKTAVTSLSPRLLVLAGAGSGKTKVLVHRMAWLSTTQATPLSRVLAVTFTNKAASEMKKRLTSLLEISGSTLWVGTFHGLCHRILRRHAEAAGLSASFQIIDASDQLRIVERLVREMGLKEVCQAKQVIAFINRQKEEGKRVIKVVPTSLPEMRYWIELYRLYENYCQRQGLVDFSEILLRTYELWCEQESILKEYQERFQHILLDEFQDTNTIQYAWLKKLCTPSSTLTIVGDDDQSIYGWRGAKIENIHRLEHDFCGLATVRLEQNYRSSSEILKAANALIAHNRSRLGKELWTQSSSGEKITLYSALNEIDEARFLVERIRHWKEKGGKYEEAAVLYRSNTQSRVIEQLLRQAGVPYRIYGGLRFFDRAEVKDVLAYLRLLVHEGDDTAFERIVNLPPRGVGDRTLEAIRELTKIHSSAFMSAAKSYCVTLPGGKIQRGLQQFFDCIESLRAQLPLLTLDALVHHVLQQSGLLASLQAGKGEDKQSKIDNLLELTIAAQQFHHSYEEMHGSKKADTTLPLFLSEVALEAQRDSPETEEVKLMTLHAAKGLEFPLVFLAGMEEGLFPHARSQEGHLLEEERRLCYVGITRAMHKLYMTYAQKRAFSGNFEGANQPSRFIEEISPAVFDFASPVSQQILSPRASVSRFSSKKHKRGARDDLPFGIGQRVVHPTFGKGVIIGAEGEGPSTRLHVRFSRGEKWLVLQYAKLEKSV